MNVFAGHPDGWPVLTRSAVTVGVFDGVHRGHQTVLSSLVSKASDNGLQPVVLTFEPHPIEVTAPDRAPRLLTSLEQRIEVFGALGVEVVGVLALTDIRHFTAEIFIQRVLVARLHPELLVVGPDFRFGYGRSGDVAALAEGGRVHAFSVEVVAPVVDEGTEPISSTRIRALVAVGRMTEATGLLGRPFQLLGQVVAGERRGRILGFPTANLFVSPRLLLPADGVYAAWARVGDALHRAMVNIGVRPTFGSGAHTVEAHLLDFEEEIYGREMRLDFMERLREEQRFGSVEALTEQLNQDLINAKEILG